MPVDLDEKRPGRPFTPEKGLPSIVAQDRASFALLEISVKISSHRSFTEQAARAGPENLQGEHMRNILRAPVRHGCDGVLLPAPRSEWSG